MSDGEARVSLEQAETQASALLLPLPPSMNHYWRSVQVKGRCQPKVSKEGRRYKELAALAAVAHKPIKYQGEVSVSAVFHMARLGVDLDNRIKPLLDALQGIVYVNDTQVVHLDVVRALDRDNPRVEIWVAPVLITPEEYLVKWRAKGTIE